MAKSANSLDVRVLSYLTLRKVIGFIGLLLPFVLVFGKLFFEGPGLLDSVSSYYHSVSMRDIFVGSLCAVGVFLLAYHGYDWVDDLVTGLAGFAAFGVALFPITEHAVLQKQDSLGLIHITSAALFFITLAMISLLLFTKSGKHKTKQKEIRNVIYIICGWIILLCLGLIGFVFLLIPGTSTFYAIKPIFWLEALAIVAFGVSWFVKGEAILKDE